MPASGQQCNRCLSGTWSTVGVYNGKHGHHVRYLICSRCGCKAKEVLTVDQYKRRRLKRTGSVQIAERA